MRNRDVHRYRHKHGQRRTDEVKLVLVFDAEKEPDDHEKEQDAVQEEQLAELATEKTVLPVREQEAQAGQHHQGHDMECSHFDLLNVGDNETFIKYREFPALRQPCRNSI